MTDGTGFEQKNMCEKIVGRMGRISCSSPRPTCFCFALACLFCSGKLPRSIGCATQAQIVTMSFPARSTLLRTVATASEGASRRMSTAPKLHKSKDMWGELKKTRPPLDHLDEHLVFHPPFNGAAVGVGIVFGVLAGYGTMGYGLAHQQYKQGFWK